MTTKRNMLVTAGPTHEPIDAVRYIANRSSGRMGIAIAEAARDSGWNTTLLLGPVSAALPPGMRIARFITTADLQTLLDQYFPACDVLIMAAAVADYRVDHAGQGKLVRASSRLTLELVSTPDLVARCANSKRPGQRVIGFALEDPTELERRAVTKLREKHLDAIVANPLETMDSDRVSARLLTPDGQVHSPTADSPIDKPDFARWLIQWIEAQPT